MLKFFLSAGVTAALFIMLAVSAYAVSTNAKAAVLMEAGTGRLLVAQNEEARLPMASTTKIMTALLTLEQTELDEYFTVDTEALYVEGSSMGLAPEDSVTLRILAAGMLLASGNDAANAAAVRIAGSVPDFVVLMNARAAELGMKNTSFETPSGLDADEHFSSAYDMALLAQAALNNNDFAEICSQPRMTLMFGNPPFKRWLGNHNSLLKSYEGAIGVKTGFTKKAGRCLVSAAERDGIRLICVTLSCPDDWREHTRLLDYGFAGLKSSDLSSLMPPLLLPVGGGVQKNVVLEQQHTAVVALAEGEQARVKSRVLLKRFLLAPVSKGQAVGEVRFTLDGKEILCVPLSTADDVAARELTKKHKWWSRLNLSPR